MNFMTIATRLYVASPGDMTCLRVHARGGFAVSEHLFPIACAASCTMPRSQAWRPNTQYFYRYGDSALALPSQEHSVGSLCEEGRCNILSQQCDR